MPSSKHQGLTQLFLERPSLAVEVLQRLRQPVPSHASVERRDTSFAELEVPDYRSDGMFLLEEATGRAVLGVVVEPQQQRDEDKRWVWPLYSTVGGRRHRCPVVVLVVTTSASVARWAANPIQLGAGNTFAPLVLDGEGLPWSEDHLDPASSSRELALLSLILSVKHLEAKRAATAAVLLLRIQQGIAGNDMLWDLLLAHLPQRAHQELERLMADPGNYEYQSEFARKYIAKGRELGIDEGKKLGIDEGKKLGIDEGRRQGLQAAVLALLEARGVPAGEDLRRQIEAERDEAVLRSLLARAATVSSADDLLE